MVKFRRNYSMIVGLNDGSDQIIEPPFTVEFGTQKNIFGSANEGSFVIYGLSSVLRNQIRYDITQQTLFRKFVFLAGYGEQLSMIFNGNITSAYSVRENNTWKTYVTCSEGGFAYANGKPVFTFPAGVTRNQVIDTIVNDLKNYKIEKGVVGGIFNDSLLRGNTYKAESHEKLLNDLTGGAFSIQNGKAYVIGDKQYLEGEIDTIDDSTGIRGTPKRQSTNIIVDVLLEPQIIMYQKITLKTTLGDESMNGDYKVVGISHRGIISEVVCGEAITTVTLSPVQIEKVG